MGGYARRCKNCKYYINIKEQDFIGECCNNIMRFLLAINEVVPKKCVNVFADWYCGDYELNEHKQHLQQESGDANDS